MIVQITTENKIIGGIEVYENNENVLDIDISDDFIVFNKKEFETLMSCKSNWVVFEENRKDFDLGIADDWQYAYNIIAPLQIYHIINRKEYEILKQKIDEFFKYDGKNWNREEPYQYDGLDYFLTTLHPLLDKCLHY